jgi:hypothetical protein
VARAKEKSMADTHSALMQAANENIYVALVESGSEDGDFACECDNTACFETVPMTLREYAALEPRDEGQPILALGHEKLAMGSDSPIVS